MPNVLPRMLGGGDCRAICHKNYSFNFISNISSSLLPNKLAIASSGTIQHLIQFFNGGVNNMNSISMKAKLDAITTLHNLSTCD